MYAQMMNVWWLYGLARRNLYKTSFLISNWNSVHDPAYGYCYLVRYVKKKQKQTFAFFELTVPFKENFDWAH